ncbi:hypothetical protein [Chryseolinea sp. H1M3-3]|uniref:hypothetical protein n=1 Tax=Chryseolinea sp. H1M3-3 TaxID=3034144 RepID=UPI0023EABDBF|nr:hypothetical protein [Chryseolinea sp. H1M3-3]
MKKKIHAQQHPNQEDKSGNAVYASLTSVNSSTNQPLAHDADMAEGAESDYKKALANSKKKPSSALSHKSSKQ